MTRNVAQASVLKTPFGARRLPGEVARLLAQRCLFVPDGWVEKGH